MQLGGGRICVAVRVRPLDLTRDESVLLDSHPVLQLLDAGRLPELTYPQMQAICATY